MSSVQTTANPPPGPFPATNLKERTLTLRRPNPPVPRLLHAHCRSARLMTGSRSSLCESNICGPITEVDLMALLHIPLDQIDEARLHALITSESVESRTIEYKCTIYGKTHNDYSEFLADTSSFANTSGGDLGGVDEFLVEEIFGIPEV